MALVENSMAEGSELKVKTAMDATGKTVYSFATGLKAGSTWQGKAVVANNAGNGQINLDDAKQEELDAMNAVIDTYATEMGIVAVDLAEGDNNVQSTDKEFEYNAGVDLSLHVGADSSSTNKIEMTINAMSADYLGVKGLKVDGKSYLQATAAIDVIAEAISKVSEQRSALGAVQNRLEHTIANLDNVVENTTAAESRIRDTDMAEEMVEYSKNNILAQAGQSMLAQANTSTQGVLSLLQ
jgi:flagellin